MAGQSTSGWETAPAVHIAVICFASSVGCSSARVMKDQREVGPLSRGMLVRCTHSLSAPLQDGLRLFPPPVPATLSACLATRFPLGGTLRAYHVPHTRLDG